VTSNHLSLPFCISALVFVAGCAALQAGQEVQSGRNALLKEQPAAAIAYFRRAADLDPNYTTPFSRGESVWTYLGRAYYEAGNYSAAQQALAKALSLDKDNPVAQLYLGLSILRSGDSEKGTREVQSALKGIYDWLNRAASRPTNGIYWDPAKEIRNEIQRILAGKPESAELISVAEWVGRRIDEEPDRVRRDEARDKYETGRSD
jgi:tetratricopeptide (TPR) repeat protein